MTTSNSIKPHEAAVENVPCSTCEYIRSSLQSIETNPHGSHDERSGWPLIALNLETLRPQINDPNFVREAHRKQQSIPWHAVDKQYMEKIEPHCVMERSLDRIAELWALGQANFVAGQFLENDSLGYFKDPYLMFSLTTGWSCEIWLSTNTDESKSKCQRTRALVDMDYGALQTYKATWFPKRPIWPDPLHPRVIARIKEWFWDCDKSGWRHPCRKTKPVTILPARFLEIDSAGTRLVNTDMLELPLRERYFALSHCWGNSQPFRTLKSNLDAHLTSIDESALPQTLKDAIALARAIEFRYIWIDSLCIVQDDEEDWRKEAALMADVYNNAYVTVSAANASGDDEGFLQPRHPQTATVQVTLPNGKYTEFFIAPPLIQTTKKDESIDTRAWTYQEGLLSRRILRFHRNEMTFDCLANTKNRTWRESRRVSETGHEPKGRVLLPDIISQIGTCQNWEAWTSKIIGPFLERKLSFEKDRLPALAGLARRVAESLQEASDGPMGEYLAGIFSNHVYREERIPRSVVFLWRPKQPIIPSSNQSYYVPSWSFLRAGGPVEFYPEEWNTRGVRYKIGLIANNLELVGSDRFGSLSGGHIILHAPLVLLSHEEDRADEPTYPFRARYWLDSAGDAPVKALGIVMEFSDFGPRTKQTLSGIGPAVRGVLLQEVRSKQETNMSLPHRLTEGEIANEISTRTWRRIGLFETIPFDYDSWKEILSKEVCELDIRLV